MFKPFNELGSDARIWIYQSDRPLSEDELKVVRSAMGTFVESWKSHGQHVQGSFDVRYGQFIVIGAEEPEGDVSGCSIDSSVAVLKSLEVSLGINLFDRTLVLWKEEGEIRQSPMNEFWALRKSGKVDDSTTVFNNLVKTKAEFDTSWECSFSESWHAQMW